MLKPASDLIHQAPIKLSILIPTAKMVRSIKEIVESSKVTDLTPEAILSSLIHLALKNLSTEHWDTYEVSQWMADTADYYSGGFDPESEQTAAQFENAILAVYTDLIEELRTFLRTSEDTFPPWDEIDYQVNVLTKGKHVEIISMVSQ